MLAAKIYLVCLGIGFVLFAALPAEDTYVYPTTVQEIQTERIETVVQSETGTLTLAIQDAKALAARTSNAVQLEVQTNMAQAAEIQDLKGIVAQLSNALQLEIQARAAVGTPEKGALALAASACNDIQLERQDRAADDLAINAAAQAEAREREVADASLLDAMGQQRAALDTRINGVANGAAAANGRLENDMLAISAELGTSIRQNDDWLEARIKRVDSIADSLAVIVLLLSVAVVGSFALGTIIYIRAKRRGKL